MLLPVLGRTTTTRMRLFATAFLAVATLAASLTFYISARASDDGDRCARFARVSAERASADTGHGRRVAVIGDSYSVGLGLEDPQRSWPSRLTGRVHVAGFSGSGFSAVASPCGRVSFAARAAAAMRGADLVIVEGGLNDVGHSGAEIRAGFRRLMRTLNGHDVVVVGPAAAPARAAGAVRVDRLLAALSVRRDVAYVSMLGLELDYLADDLHLTPAGHAEFGDHVAAAIRSYAG